MARSLSNFARSAAAGALGKRRAAFSRSVLFSRSQSAASGGTSLAFSVPFPTSVNSAGRVASRLASSVIAAGCASLGIAVNCAEMAGPICASSKGSSAPSAAFRTSVLASPVASASSGDTAEAVFVSPSVRMQRSRSSSFAFGSAMSFSASATAAASPWRMRKPMEVLPAFTSAVTSSSGSGGSARPLNSFSKTVTSAGRIDSSACLKSVDAAMKSARVPDAANRRIIRGAICSRIIGRSFRVFAK